MAKRSYGQYCGLAHALDLIGERWSLLVIRELMTGPKRYKDLLKRLPGIGTNLLAQRLKFQEEQGILEPPAGSSDSFFVEGMMQSGLRLYGSRRLIAAFLRPKRRSLHQVTSFTIFF